MEQSSGAAYMPVAVLASRDEVVLVQSESRIDVAKFEDLLKAGIDAAKQVRSPGMDGLVQGKYLMHSWRP